MDLESALLIAALALVTYATRIGGHIMLSRFGRLGPRAEAALEAVPAAVMTAVAAPLALASGAATMAGAAATALASLRLPIHAAVLVGVAVVAALRLAGL